jgi:hypothetical protein
MVYCIHVNSEYLYALDIVSFKDQCFKVFKVITHIKQTFNNSHKAITEQNGSKMDCAIQIFLHFHELHMIIYDYQEC